MSDAPQTPNCDRLRLYMNDVKTLSEFFEWLEEQKFALSKFHEHTSGCYARPEDDNVSGRVCGYSIDDREPVREAPNTLIMRWLGIDIDALERERRAILAHHRAPTGAGAPASLVSLPPPA